MNVIASGSERFVCSYDAVTLSVGSPSSFQALMPPARWALYGKPGGLRHQRGGHRAVARAAGEHDLPALRIGDRRRIELRHREIEGLRIALDLGLVRLADIDQQDPALGQPARHVFRGQVVHVLAAEAECGMGLPPRSGAAAAPRARSRASRPGIKRAIDRFLCRKRSNRDLGADLDHPAGRESGRSRWRRSPISPAR